MKSRSNSFYGFGESKRQRCFNIAAALWTCWVATSTSAKHLSKEVAKTLAAKIILIKTKPTSAAAKG
jgi:hypothetical protein